MTSAWKFSTDDLERTGLRRKLASSWLWCADTAEAACLLAALANECPTWVSRGARRIRTATPSRRSPLPSTWLVSTGCRRFRTLASKSRRYELSSIVDVCTVAPVPESCSAPALHPGAGDNHTGGNSQADGRHQLYNNDSFFFFILEETNALTQQVKTDASLLPAPCIPLSAREPPQENMRGRQ